MKIFGQFTQRQVCFGQNSDTKTQAHKLLLDVVGQVVLRISPPGPQEDQDEEDEDEADHRAHGGSCDHTCIRSCTGKQ